MSPKPTLYLLADCRGAHGAFFYFYENKQPGTREAHSDARSPGHDSSATTVAGITITDHDLKIELVKATPERHLQPGRSRPGA